MLSNTAVPIYYGEFREQVLNGEIPINEEIGLHMNNVDEIIANPAFYYDDSAIDGFIRYCEDEMVLTDGSDLQLLPSFKLWAEDLLSWFYYAEEKIYSMEEKGYIYRTVKRRLRNKQYLIVARGAAKSMYAALLHSYILVMDFTRTHQIVTAPTMIQADETMSPIATAITRAKGPLLEFMTEGSILSNTHTKVKLASTKKGIENFMTNSIIQVRPMSIKKLQGLRSKMNSVDEWLSGEIKEDVIGAIEQGASKVDDYIILATSSEGTSRDGPGDTIKLELSDILNNKYYNPHVSIWYYRLDDISEVENPEMWLKANPNLGATISYKAYQEDVDRAKANPAARNDILAKRFGIPVEGFTYFFTYDETLVHKKQNFDNLECSMGGDLSQGDDFCAFTFLFPLGGEKIGIKTRAYVSDVKVKRLPIAMYNKYQEFIQEGTLVAMPGSVLNMMRVYEDLDEFIEKHRYSVISFGFDPYNSKEFVERWSNERGPFGVEKVQQGVKTESVPLGELKVLASERMIIFDEQLMKFAMGNAVAIQDNNGNYKLSKLRAQEKIDNVSAMMDAWVAYKRYQEAFV